MPVVMSLRRESLLMVILMCAGLARDHCSRAIFESSTTNHDNVNEQEQYKDQRGEEMNGACRLLASEGRRREGKHRYECGRHRQTRPYHQREQTEYDHEIRKALKHVIRP